MVQSIMVAQNADICKLKFVKTACHILVLGKKTAKALSSVLNHCV